MLLTVNQLAWGVIAATLPLNFLSQLPGRWASAALLCLALLLAQLRWAMAVKMGLVLLLFVWSAGSGITLLENIQQLTRRPLQAEVIIENVLPDGERIKIRVWRYQQHMLFPPLYAVVKVSPRSLSLFARGSAGRCSWR